MEIGDGHQAVMDEMRHAPYASKTPSVERNAAGMAKNLLIKLSKWEEEFLEKDFWSVCRGLDRLRERLVEVREGVGGEDNAVLSKRADMGIPGGDKKPKTKEVEA